MSLAEEICDRKRPSCKSQPNVQFHQSPSAFTKCTGVSGMVGGWVNNKAILSVHSLKVRFTVLN